MSNNCLYENDSLWLKQKSQENRVQRFKQLEFDFGPNINEQMMNNDNIKGDLNG